MADTDDLLKEARDALERARSYESDNRAAALDDIRFARLGEQWPSDIKSKREAEGRPCLTINRMPTFIRQVVNDARQNKPAIKVRPADSVADPRTAEVITGLMRNIEHVSNADVAYDTAIESAVSGGFGYIRVKTDYAYNDAFDLDILIERVANPFTVYGDPDSTSADGSDWNCAFVVDRITKAEFKARYGDKANVDFDGVEWQDAADWLDDEGVVIAEYWKREEVEKTLLRLSNGIIVTQDQAEDDPDIALALASGMVQITGTRQTRGHRVTQYILSGVDVLETSECPGCYIPIIPVYGDEFTVEGKRYFRSLIHHSKDPQRMLNYWRSTSTELVALAPRVPFIGPRGAFKTDIDRWNTANVESHAFLEYDGPVSPQRQPLDMGVAAGALQEALNANDDIKSTMGMFDASLGARSNEASGRAIMARQREGDVATFHFIDNLNRAIRHTGRVILDLIPHVYTGERILRVLGEDNKPRNVPMGQPTPALGMDGRPETDEAGQVVMAIHDLSRGKYDLTVESGPAYTTSRQETAQIMQEVIRAFPQAAPILGGDLAKVLDFPGADKIAEKLAKLDPTNQPQGQNPEAQKMQADMAKAQAEMQMKAQQAQADMAMERERLQAEMTLKREQMAAEMALKREQIAAEMQLKTEVAAVNAANGMAMPAVRVGGQPG